MPTILKIVTLDAHIHTHIYTNLSGGVREKNENVRAINNIKFTQQNLFHSVLLLIDGSSKSKCSEKFR